MCKINDTTISSDGAAVAVAINAIADAVKLTNPTLAEELTLAANTLSSVTSSWKTGSPVEDINVAAKAIEDILAVIPVTAPYSAFVGIAVAALDILIGNISTQASHSTNPVANAVMVSRYAETELKENPYRGAIKIKRHAFEGPRTAFIRAWNNQVSVQPELAFPTLA